MTCNAFPLIEDSDNGCLALEQGASLGYPPGRCISFIVTGTGITADLQNWTAVGQITSNYFDKNPTVYATFSFDPPVYGTYTLANGSVVTGVAVTPKLTLAQSEAIPRPKKPWDGVDSAVVGKNCWLYEIRLVSPDGTIALDVVNPSYVQVLGRSTA